LFILAVLVTSRVIPIRFAWAFEEDSWATKTRMGITNTLFGVAVVNGKIYVMGGHPIGRTQFTIDANLEYDIATDTWTSRTHMPGISAGFGTAVYQNEIYVFGGFWGIGPGPLSTVRVYNPETKTWTGRTSMPTARAGVQANVVDGKIYVIGGSSGEPVNVNEVYNPLTDTWAAKAPIPTPVSYSASAVVDGKIYVIGGLAPVANSSQTYVNLNQIYDPKTNTWNLGAPMPNIPDSISAGATTGVMAPKRIYVIGDGLNQIYDPASDSWTFGAPIPNSTHRLTNFADAEVAVYNDQLYAIGGVYAEGDSLYSVNEQYTPIGYCFVSPEISVFSPENKTYASSNISLTFTMNKHAAWMGYSLDGQETVTIAGNTTLESLAIGLHNITVFAKDELENAGNSETIRFTVAKEPEPEPFSAMWFATGVAIAVATGAASLAAYYVRCRRTSKTVQ